MHLGVTFEICKKASADKVFELPKILKKAIKLCERKIDKSNMDKRRVKYIG